MRANLEEANSDILLLYILTGPFALDTNQCSNGNGGCAQNCTDHIPGFECSCREGYELDSDGLTCNGK